MSPQPPKPPPDDEVIKEKSDAEKSFEAPKPQVVKVKADKEFVPEKVKPEKEKIEVKEIEVDKFKDDNEKPLEKLKPEKEAKLEAKEIEKAKRDDEKPLEKFKRDDEKGKVEAKEIEGPLGGVAGTEEKFQQEGTWHGVTGGVSEGTPPRTRHLRVAQARQEPRGVRAPATPFHRAQPATRPQRGRAGQRGRPAGHARSGVRRRLTPRSWRRVAGLSCARRPTRLRCGSTSGCTRAAACPSGCSVSRR